MPVHSSELQDIYGELRLRIVSTISEFQHIWIEKDPNRIFRELVFCLFTPQSKARVCWDAVETLSDDDLLLNGCSEDISDSIRQVRFRNNKASYLVALRDRYGPPQGTLELIYQLESRDDSQVRRQWLVDNIKGLGYKESSHFLRNIGIGGDIAILDRHILRNLVKYEVIETMPTSLTPSRYRDIESKMCTFSEAIGIPMDHLDLLFWYIQTGDIFK